MIVNRPDSRRSKHELLKRSNLSTRQLSTTTCLPPTYQPAVAVALALFDRCLRGIPMMYWTYVLVLSPLGLECMLHVYNYIYYQ